MKAIICTITALLLSLLLLGCGQSGPLYVPGDPSSINVQPEPASSEEETAEDGEESEDGEETDRQ